MVGYGIEPSSPALKQTHSQNAMSNLQYTGPSSCGEGEGYSLVTTLRSPMECMPRTAVVELLGIAPRSEQPICILLFTKCAYGSQLLVESISAPYEYTVKNASSQVTISFSFALHQSLGHEW